MPPPVERSNFTERLIRENRLDRTGFSAWFFQPGMAFQAKEKWWGGGGLRRTPHEGIDLCRFKDRWNRIVHLGVETRIPALYDGVVVRMITDFLGQSIFMEHRVSAAPRGRLFTLYGHTLPEAGIRVGKSVKTGDIVATLADPGRSGKKISPHLHLSLAWASGPVPLDRLDWHTINEISRLTLMDPMPVITGS